MDRQIDTNQIPCLHKSCKKNKLSFKRITLKRFTASRSYALLFGLFLLLSCAGKDHTRSVYPAFYHWQTKMDLTHAEQTYLDSLQVKKLYCKFFDVDWNGEAYPTASIEWGSEVQDYEIVPTVFITNRTLLEIEEDDLASLSQKIADKIKRLAPPQGFQEVQFDCDWTGKTQAKYFELLRILGTHFPEKKLSATIRLHQIKFFERTGVPPIDRGMLMCYNIGEVGEWETENSILDTLIVPQYLHNFDGYPLRLDLALPIFHWGLIFRDGHLSRILNNLEERDLQDSTRFRLWTSESSSPSPSKVERTHGHPSTRYEVIKSTYLDGHFLYEGDRIRLEAISPKVLHRTVEMLAAELPRTNLNIAFYHLDTTTIQQHPYEQLDTILQIFE